MRLQRRCSAQGVVSGEVTERNDAQPEGAGQHESLLVIRNSRQSTASTADSSDASSDWRVRIGRARARGVRGSCRCACCVFDRGHCTRCQAVVSHTEMRVALILRHADCQLFAYFALVSLVINGGVVICVAVRIFAPIRTSLCARMWRALRHMKV